MPESGWKMLLLLFCAAGIAYLAFQLLNASHEERANGGYNGASTGGPQIVSRAAWAAAPQQAQA